MAKFPPGQSGNPGGRPAGRGVIGRLARGYTAEAVFALARVANDVRAAPLLQYRAALALLAYGYGRMPTRQEAQQEGGGVGLGRWPHLRPRIMDLVDRH